MAAPNLKEIEWAIQELESEESSKAGYILLGALYACRNEMMGTPPAARVPQISAYSEAAAPIDEKLGRYGDSDFLRAVEGLDPTAAWEVMDWHMNSLYVVNPRAYESVMAKLRNL